jgi:hypothetical protein
MLKVVDNNVGSPLLHLGKTISILPAAAAASRAYAA